MSMPATLVSDEPTPVRGLGLRLIAVALILVGALDMMLSWRGSMQVSGFYVAIFTTGVVLYGVASVLASRGAAQNQPGSEDRS